MFNSTCIEVRTPFSEFKVPYLHESSAHPFQGFLGPKNRVRIRINGALDAQAKSETMISLLVGS